MLILNPFAIYTCSFYSESLFFLSQCAILYIIQRSVFLYERLTFCYLLLSMAPLLMGCFIRSNGFFSAGYLIYYLIMSPGSTRKIVKLCCFITPIIIIIFVSFMPFFIYNFWAYYSVCTSPSDQNLSISELCLNYTQGNHQKIKKVYKIY